MYFNIEADIDLHDVYSQLSNSDLKRLIQWLKDDEIIGSEFEDVKIDNPNDIIFRDAIAKIATNKHRLTIAQEDVIYKIAKSL